MVNLVLDRGWCLTHGWFIGVQLIFGELLDSWWLIGGWCLAGSEFVVDAG